MGIRPRVLVYDVAILMILTLFCAMLGAYHGGDAGFAAAVLVFLAYGAGRRAAYDIA